MKPSYVQSGKSNLNIVIVLPELSALKAAGKANSFPKKDNFF
ncbi:hypothetical protein WG906_09355 [Pedobacter sp. P351]